LACATPPKKGPIDEVYGFDTLTDAIQRDNYLVLACPLTETTRWIIDD
jgi:phosphoglycerate dehydrogenase-like enzyme